jgi:nucleoside 2-deoxyribosyltransferase
MEEYMKLKIYISASLINAPINLRIAKVLEQEGHEVFLPQLFCPDELPHEHYPGKIYRMCVEKMEESDLGLVLLDCYGHDTSWECGWFSARKKPLVGFVNFNLRFLRDWLIKGGLHSVITTDPEIKKYLENDLILKSRSIYHIQKINELGIAIEKYCMVQ